MKEVKKVTRQVVVDAEVYECPLCSKTYSSSEEATKCLNKDISILEKQKAQMEKEQKERIVKVEAALAKMPKLSEEEYTKEAIMIAVMYAPEIIPCICCGHPKAVGYCCPNNDCPDNVDDIDEEDVFYDDRFEMPDTKYWDIVFKDGEEHD